MIEYEEIAELEKYADMEGTELGEVCHQLIAVWHNSDYVSDGFASSLEKEIKKKLTWFRTNTKIVKRKVKPEPYYVEELEDV